MCIKIGVENNGSFFKTSYQRAHYYENLQNLNFAVDRPLFRPELYYSDPIFKKRSSTYRHHYDVKNSKEKDVEFYGKFDLTSRHTLKSLYDEYKCKPVTVLKYDRTLSGLHYQDPSGLYDTKLLENFCNESSIVAKEINSSSSEKPRYVEYTEPYTTIYESHFENTVDARKNGIAKNDVITFYNKREKNKQPVPETIRNVKFKSFFTVPFNGDSSIYQSDFQDPQFKNAFLSEACSFPSYFETIKNETTEIPAAYMAERK